MIMCYVEEMTLGATIGHYNEGAQQKTTQQSTLKKVFLFAFGFCSLLNFGDHKTRIFRHII